MLLRRYKILINYHEGGNFAKSYLLLEYSIWDYDNKNTTLAFIYLFCTNSIERVFYLPPVWENTIQMDMNHYQKITFDSLITDISCTKLSNTVLIFVQIWFNIKISYTLWEVLWLEKMYIYTLSPESS